MGTVLFAIMVRNDIWEEQDQVSKYPGGLNFLLQGARCGRLMLSRDKVIQAYLALSLNVRYQVT